ncbi:hypothetical protein MRX96_041891 [Rhipicephalus microplus]
MKVCTPRVDAALAFPMTPLFRFVLLGLPSPFPFLGIADRQSVGRRTVLQRLQALSDGGAPAALLADGQPLVRRHDHHPVLRSRSPLVEAVVALAYVEAVLTPPGDCAASCIGIFWVVWLFAFEDSFRAVAFPADPSVSMSAHSGSCLAPRFFVNSFMGYSRQLGGIPGTAVLQVE